MEINWGKINKAWNTADNSLIPSHPNIPIISKVTYAYFSSLKFCKIR